jgi:hypothetical protein
VLLVFKVFKVLKVLKVHKVTMVLKDQWVLKAFKDYQVLLV